MTEWLQPLRVRLDAAAHPVRFFFRDDDVGWSDQQLWRLLDRFADTGAPVDLAVIPAALSERLVTTLRGRVDRAAVRLDLHQHGWAHVNHEPAGRKGEFGPSRRAEEVRADLQRGRAALRAAFGAASAGVFVPPWNRCTETTARVLRDDGVLALSRDTTAEPFALAGLAELPVTVDWHAKRGGGGHVSRAERGELLAAATEGPRAVGVMLHHAVMTNEDLDDVAELTDLLHAHPRSVLCSMLDLLE
jgi:peptidoglycan/xylan/chitin deacetylase (PgdA/CDA1 family)